MAVTCPGKLIKKHDVVPKPPEDAEIGERGTCTRCACRYEVVGVDPIRLKALGGGTVKAKNKSKPGK